MRLVKKISGTASRILAAVVCGAVLISFAGCNKKIYLSTGLKNNEVFKVAGHTCSIGQMQLILSAQKEEYEEIFDENVWAGKFGNTSLAEQVKDQVLNNMLGLYSIKAMAKEKNIELNVDEKNLLTEAAGIYYDSLSEEVTEKLQLSKDDVISLYSDFYLAIKLYDSYTANANIEISDSKARVIRVQSIFFKTYELDDKLQKVSFDEEKKQQIRSTAEEVLSKIKGGNDFSTLAIKYSEDENIQYTFGAGEMIEEYEEAAFALSSGEVSNIVETEEGFYIIKCISDYLETETYENKEKMIEVYKQELFMEKYRPFKKSLSFEVNKSLWESISMDTGETDIGNFYEEFNKAVEKLTNR